MINKVIFIALIAILNAFAVCSDALKAKATLTPYKLPIETNDYTIYHNTGKFNDSTKIQVGSNFAYVKWQTAASYQAHDIECEVTNIMAIYNQIEDNVDCYEIEMHCEVTDKCIYYDEVNDKCVGYYNDTIGYRNDGTRLWQLSADDNGEDIIQCYDVNGMHVNKVVNNPIHCK